MNTKEDFWKKVNKSSYCWLFCGALTKMGYGRCSFRGKNWQAHRLSYTFTNGDIPGDLCCLHKCDVRNCVNPDHLWLGTPKDNSIDMVQKGRGKTPNLGGSDHPRAKLMESDIKLIREDRRYLWDIARDYEVTAATISYIKRGKTWKHVVGGSAPAPKPRLPKQLSTNEVRNIRVDRQPMRQIADAYNVSRDTVHYIKAGKMRMDVPPSEIYVNRRWFGTKRLDLLS